MDVKTTFLNGVIEKEVYIEQLEGFETHEKESHVCRLKKALYRLKQAPRAWIIQAHQILQGEPSHKIQNEGFGTDALFLGVEVIRILCDNQSCIKLSENLVFHDRSKHIDIRCRFIRDCVQRGAVQLRYTPTGEQVADVLTKALGRTKFVYIRERIGMVKNPF
eukprot:PITA_32208